MSGPFKMKGFSGFGNSPLRQDKKPLTDAEIKKGNKMFNKLDSKLAQQKLYDLEHNAQDLRDKKTGITPPISRESFERNYNLNTKAARDTTGAYMHQVIQGE